LSGNAQLEVFSDPDFAIGFDMAKRLSKQVSAARGEKKKILLFLANYAKHCQCPVNCLADIAMCYRLINMGHWPGKPSGSNLLQQI